MNYEIIQFEGHGDDRGMLIAIEEEKNIPFKAKRIYYLFNTVDGVRRGFHAHKQLQQVLICVKGSCKILLDDGQVKEVIELDNPFDGLYIQSNLWREMYDFSEDAVLLVVASEYYDESDYIRDYEEFLEYRKGL